MLFVYLRPIIRAIYVFTPNPYDGVYLTVRCFTRRTKS